MSDFNERKHKYNKKCNYINLILCGATISIFGLNPMHMLVHVIYVKDILMEMPMYLFQIFMTLLKTRTHQATQIVVQKLMIIQTQMTQMIQKIRIIRIKQRNKILITM